VFITLLSEERNWWCLLH